MISLPIAPKFKLLTRLEVLLFVFWYLHKRGRETRLAREAGLKEADESSDIEPSDVEENDNDERVKETAK